MKHFEWDENKREVNIDKHGIDFIDAIKVFTDPDRIEFESNRNQEHRIQTIGLIADIVIVLVVYVYRNGKKRIISARRANKKEREAYHHLR